MTDRIEVAKAKLADMLIVYSRDGLDAATAYADEIRAAEIEAAKMEGGIAGLELALILCKQVEGHYQYDDDERCRFAVMAIHEVMSKIAAKIKEARHAEV